MEFIAKRIERRHRALVTVIWSRQHAMATWLSLLTPNAKQREGPVSRTQNKILSSLEGSTFQQSATLDHNREDGWSLVDPFLYKILGWIRP